MARKRKKSKAKKEARKAKASEEAIPSTEAEPSPEDTQPKKKASGKKRAPKKESAPKKKSVGRKVRTPKKESAPKKVAAGKQTPARETVSTSDPGPDRSTEVMDADGEVTDVGGDVTDLDDKPHDLEEADSDETLAQLVAAASGADEDSEDSSDSAVSPDIEGTVEPEPSSDPSSATAPSDDAADPGGDAEVGAPDLGDVSTPEDRERLLQATLAHAAMQEAMYRVPIDTGQAHRWKGTIASTIFFIAVVVGLSPPGILVPEAPARLTLADHQYGVRVTLLLQAEQIEAFRSRERRLPDSLTDVAATFPGVRFVKSGNRLYQLIAYTPDGMAVVYDSSTPAPEFEAISRAFAPTGVGG